MSTRNMRKLFGTTTLPPPDDENSDDDFVPLYTRKESSSAAYAVLEVNSTSEPEVEPDSKQEEVEVEHLQQEKKKKKNNRKKRKGKAATNTFDMDEIDRSVREVNALLGEPIPVVQIPVKKVNPEATLFAVQQKHLDANNELRRIFGPESEEEERRRQRQHNVKHQKNIVIPKAYTFNKLGLSMSIKNRESDITYFTFDHNKEYRKMYQTFLDNVAGLRAAGVMPPLEDLLKTMHVEALLESADIFFRMENYNLANDIIEQCIAYLQYVAHPCFTLTGRRCRLEYKYIENRPFHVALLKYLHLLTNRACHRTALEIAKALLNLDPSDPLAVIFIIDTLALRAREHKWLNEAVEYWNTTREGEYLFNLQFSRAMCCFHLSKSKNKECKLKANKILKDCMLKFPFVLMKILQCSNQSLSAQLKNSYLFNGFAAQNTPKSLQDLMSLYAKFTWSRWREPPVMEWLLKNATELSIKYDTDVREQTIALKEVQKQLSVLQKWPVEVVRHLCVITPMSELLVDGAVPEVPAYLSADPVPPTENNINRYGYQQQRQVNRQFLLEFLRTLQPFFDDNDTMFHSNPTSIFCIIATEFCERFSFCGLRTILSLYLRNVLCLHENAATVVYHIFIMMCYTMPLVGAILADNFIGRYKVILYFSIIYLFGTILTCCSAIPPLMLPPTTTSMIGLALIATGTGGIKPCVAAFGGDQFRLPEENQRLQRFFSTFYCTVNLGGFMGTIVTPTLRRSVMCFGDDTCYALGFGFPSLLVLISIVTFIAGKPWYRIKKPRDTITLKFVACAWYAFKKRIRHDINVDGPPCHHWLDYAIHKYGDKLVSDMKVVCSILYLYLPVPIFWSLFDQQGSRWTFQASRLRSEIFGVTLMPDQLQVMNPAMVLLMIPVCPGGAWPVLPDLPPLHKMFIGGILAAMAFVSAGILQIGIERSTLQAPSHDQTGLVLLNTLSCPVEVGVRGEGIAHIEEQGTALMTSLVHQTYLTSASSTVVCAGRIMKRHLVTARINTVGGMFMPIIIGQNSDDEISFYFMDPNPFMKSLTGKPKLKVVYIGDTGPNKNVSITVETDKQLSDIYYVSNAPIDHIGESAYMCLQPGRFRWRASSAGGEVSGSGEGYLRAGGVYVLCLRERLGRLDTAVLHSPNPPNELHLAWIVPQYFLISVAEIMFAVSGLEFSFTQAPKSMKTITIAAWYVSVAIGNLIVILVAQTKIFESRATEFFVYAAVLTIAMLVFLKMAQGYCTRTMEGDGSSTESHPLLRHHSRVISVHSLSTSTRPRTYSGPASSAASCMGLMERARPAAWPTNAFVHLATPSSSDVKATTLAKD
ncbi:uncharacterized protein LOC119835705 [Zerene cesonia]|uniref:uncharacterized protein LOC119835705 n=1 Tax=Zerene cesonia TaxID=33412 RepID=UPI0018E50C2A|nr:uncharacterized protein LOC119835705 [Zerene cesonia]